MTLPKQLYPISSQPFSDIRKRNMVYIDKTDMIYSMTHGASDYIFLSRPRRFGKSLLVSTLKEYFEGNRELFRVQPKLSKAKALHRGIPA